MKLSSLGLDAKFDRWRPGQIEAIWDILRPDPRVLPLNAPTGFGKSLVYIAAAVLSGMRTLALTSTKALQDQLGRDFDKFIVDIRGQHNYRCDFDAITRLSGVMVDAGPCQIGTACDLKDNGCAYYDKRRLAMKAPLVISNYAYHLYSNMYGDGLGEFDVIVCDEAHLAPHELSDALAVRVSHSLVQFGHLDEFPEGEDRDEWRHWFRDQGERVMLLFEKAKNRARYEPTIGVLRSVQRFRKLAQKMSMGERVDDTWVVERGLDERRHPYVHWEPIWPGPYAESHLFVNTPKVVLVSATLRAKTLQLLGLERQPVTEFASPFPLRYRRVTAVRGPRVDARTWHKVKSVWVALIDSIIEQRLDRQGIVQTVSYERARFLLENSRYSRYMVSHDRDSTKEVIARFKNGKGKVLVSPSVGTGFDFPYDECRYNILAKIPFPDTRAPIMAARVEDDAGYRDFYAATELEQAAGRGVRAEDDWCETFIIDGHFSWFFRMALKYFTDNFKQAVQWADEPPAPPGMEGP